MIFSTAAYTHTISLRVKGRGGGGRTIAEVNSFSRDSKMASLDLLPIIKWGVRAAARFIPIHVRLLSSRGRDTLP
jgi:hypothetical protein